MIAAGVFLFWHIAKHGKGNSPDPNWLKTHSRELTANGAVRLYENDLFLEQFILKKQYPEHHEEYILTYREGNGKSRNEWEYLTRSVYYGNSYGSSVPDVFHDHVDMTIYFDKDLQQQSLRDFNKYQKIQKLTFGSAEIEYADHSGNKKFDPVFPCILFGDLPSAGNHAVVVYGYTTNHVYICHFGYENDSEIYMSEGIYGSN